MGIQVYTATHDGEHNKLSAGAKRFISFNYDGKDIEDFNLIATINSNRIQQGLYANFSDSTTSYYGIDGQQYWGSTLQPLTLNFTLSTDGMEEKELDAFKLHFRPGKIAKLILAERPNRYIFARVAAAPAMSVLPFKKELTFLGEKIDTTEYKGDINLSLIADDPLWLSDWAIAPHMLTQEDKRIIYEDNIPILPASAKWIGNESDPGYSDVDSLTVTPYNIIFADNKVFQRIVEEGETLQTGYASTFYKDKKLYVYNCGTALADTILSFSFTVKDMRENFVTFPKNSFTDSVPYSYIQLSKDTFPTQRFCFTLPSFLYSHNRFVKLTKELNEQIQTGIADKDVFHFRTKLIEELPNYHYRKVLLKKYDDSYEGKIEIESAINLSIISGVVEIIKNLEFSVRFDSKTGQSFITYTLEDENETIVESCGEMVCSEMFKIDGGDSYQILSTRIAYNPHILETDVLSSNPLSNFTLTYKYTYY